MWTPEWFRIIQNGASCLWDILFHESWFTSITSFGTYRKENGRCYKINNMRYKILLFITLHTRGTKEHRKFKTKYMNNMKCMKYNMKYMNNMKGFGHYVIHIYYQSSKILSFSTNRFFKYGVRSDFLYTPLLISIKLLAWFNDSKFFKTKYLR